MKKTIILVLILQVCLVLSQEPYFDEIDLNVLLQAKKTDDIYETLRIEKINQYFEAFKTELSGLELKKFYKKLLTLVIDCEQLIYSSSVVSNKEIARFLDSGLHLVHKKFHLKGDLDEFLAKFNKNETDFVLLHNVIDEEIIKSNDFNFKNSIEQFNENDNQFKSGNLDNIEFTAKKLKKNMDRIRKIQRIADTKEGLHDDINDGHLFFEKDLDE